MTALLLTLGLAAAAPAGAAPHRDLLLHTLSGHADEVRAVAFSPDGRTLASAGADRDIRLWRVRDGLPLETLKGHKKAVTSLKYDPWGEFLFSGSLDASVRFWPLDNPNKTPPILKRQLGGVLALDAARPEKLIAFSNYPLAPGSIEVYRVRPIGGFRLDNIPVPEGCQTLAFSPDAQRLACGSSGVSIWRVRDGKRLHAFTEREGGVYAAAFSPDGRTLAAGGRGGAIGLWSVADGKLLRLLTGHKGDVNAAVFSPNGKLLATGSSDRSLRLWHAATGESLCVVKGHRAEVMALSFSPDGTLLASGGTDTDVRLWRIRDHSAEYDAAERLVKKKQFTKAIAALETFVKKRPCSAHASDARKQLADIGRYRKLFEHAKKLLADGDPSGAAEELRALLKIFDSAEARAALKRAEDAVAGKIKTDNETRAALALEAAERRIEAGELTEAKAELEAAVKAHDSGALREKYDEVMKKLEERGALAAEAEQAWSLARGFWEQAHQAQTPETLGDAKDKLARAEELYGKAEGIFSVEKDRRTLEEIRAAKKETGAALSLLAEEELKAQMHKEQALKEEETRKRRESELELRALLAVCVWAVGSIAVFLQLRGRISFLRRDFCIYLAFAAIGAGGFLIWSNRVPLADALQAAFAVEAPADE